MDKILDGGARVIVEREAIDTLGAMKANRVSFLSRCDSCGQTYHPDQDALIARFGAECLTVGRNEDFSAASWCTHCNAPGPRKGLSLWVNQTATITDTPSGGGAKA